MANKKKTVRNYDEAALSESKLRLIRSDTGYPTEYYNSLKLKLCKIELVSSHLKTLLDVGSGEGVDLVDFSKRGFYAVGLDISKSMLKRAKRYIVEQKSSDMIDLVLGDAEMLPFKGQAFDIIHSRELDCFNTYSSYVDYLNTPIFALREMRRVVKEEGFIMNMLPTKDYLGSGFNPYSEEELKYLYRHAGIRFFKAVYPNVFERILSRFIWVHTIVEKTPLKHLSYFIIGIGRKTRSKTGISDVQVDSL